MYSALAVLVPGIILLVHGAAFGGFQAYMEFDGIRGKSTAESRSTNWGQAAGVPHPDSPKPAVGASGGRNRGRVGPGSFTIVKHVDKASPKLAAICTSGRTIPKVTIRFCSPGSKQSYLVYTMTNVIISSVKPGGDNGGEVQLEEVHFTYSKITREYTGSGSGDDDSGSGPDWDVKSNRSK